MGEKEHRWWIHESKRERERESRGCVSSIIGPDIFQEGDRMGHPIPLKLSTVADNAVSMPMVFVILASDSSNLNSNASFFSNKLLMVWFCSTIWFDMSIWWDNWQSSICLDTSCATKVVQHPISKNGHVTGLNGHACSKWLVISRRWILSSPHSRVHAICL